MLPNAMGVAVDGGKMKAIINNKLSPHILKKGGPQQIRKLIVKLLQLSIGLLGIVLEGTIEDLQGIRKHFNILYNGNVLLCSFWRK